MPLSFVPISSNPISSAKNVAVGTIVSRRKSRGIFENVQIGIGDMTDEQFLNLLTKERPYGYSEFEPFIAGNYNYQYAIIKVVIRTDYENIIPRLFGLSLTVDVPDLNAYSDNIMVSALGTDVSFGKTFSSSPTVNVNVVGGVTACYPRITEITDKYFHVELVDKSGNMVSGVISWWAEGY